MLTSVVPLPGRSTASAVAAALLIAAVASGCSSSTTNTPGTTQDDATAATTVSAQATVPAGDMGATPTVSYFAPTSESFAASIEFIGDGSFVMLNLFRLKDVPDFTNHPEMKPETPMTTRELFYDYIDYMDSNLEKVGAKRVFLADSGPLLIGPEGERWDVVQMVEYPSKQSFLDLAALVAPELLKREVMLADSRIMPMHEKPLDAPNEAD